MNKSDITGFYKMTIAERIEVLSNLDILTSEESQLLKSGNQVILTHTADNMSENVIGVFGYPSQ